MIYTSQIREQLQKKDNKGNYTPVAITFIKKDGSIGISDAATFVGYDKDSQIIRFRFPSGQIRSIKEISIIKINNHEIIYG